MSGDGRPRAARWGSGPAVLGLLLAVVAAALGPMATPALAAGPTLSIVTTSTYDVRPTEHRVAVSVALSATSNLKDTKTRRYYIDRAYLAVIPSATNLKISGGSGKPTVSVSSRSATNLVLLIRFGAQLGAGKTTNLTLTFDIVDPGGAPDRALRISESLIRFEAWAFGTSGVPGSSVRVRFPGAYVASVGRGPLTGPTPDPDGSMAYASGSLATPSTFVADLAADRPGVLLDGRQSVAVGSRTVVLLIRSWPDDPAWRTSVTDLLVRGAPAIGAEVGLDWPMGPTLEVRETIARAGGDGSAGAVEGAGAFDASSGRLDIPYTADPTAILHGVAHGWFNASLVADRWAAEGFADYYAARAAQDIGVEIRSPAMTLEALSRSVPLNAWVVGGADDVFGYAAALQLARDVAARAGDDVMKAVWRDAAAGVGAYQPIVAAAQGAPAAPEPAVGTVDWRSLLDLLEAHAGRSFEGLWRAWVVRPADAALLDARASARKLYADAAATAAPWVLPRSIRDALRAWRFDDATAQLQDAMAVLGQRRDIARAAAAAGLTPPSALRGAFEGSDGLAAAAAEAVTEQAVIDRFDGVVAGEPLDPGIVARIGLIGEDPQAEIVAARGAFAAGDLDATVNHVDAAAAVWASADEVGRGRVVSGATLAFALSVLVWLAIVRRRRRRPRFGWSTVEGQRAAERRSR